MKSKIDPPMNTNYSFGFESNTLGLQETIKYNSAMSKGINYKFHEDKLIQDLKQYVDKTYSGHYSKNKFQSTEFIIDCGHGMGFALGNVLKYTQRYGKKDGYNRADLMKILHYALIALHVHDEQNLNTSETKETYNEV